MFRTAWLEHVGKVRKRENRGKNECSYREAMKLASTSWTAEKKKLERKIKRERQKTPEEVGKPPKARKVSPPEKTVVNSLENVNHSV